MAIAQRGTATNANTTGGTSVSVTKPTGVVADDIMVAVVVTNNQTVTATGWTALDATVASDGASWTVNTFWKKAGGSEGASYSFSVAASAPIVASIQAFSGADNVTPIPARATPAANGALTEPHTGPSATTTVTVGRVLYYRAARVGSPGTTATSTNDIPTFSTAVGTVSELTDTGMYTGGTVAYGQGVYLDNADFTSSGTKTGLAITLTTASAVSEAENVEGTIVLASAPSGSFAGTLGSVTSTSSGSVEDAATVDVTLGNVTSTFAGSQATAGDFNGVTLQPLSVSISGVEDQAGAVSTTLGNVTSVFAAGVVPTGTFATQLQPISAEFTVETVPFGSQVLHIEDEQRAFRITQDEMIPIYRSQATQL